MVSVNQNTNPVKVHKVPTAVGNLELLFDADGKRWTPVASLCNLIGFPLHLLASKMESRFWEAQRFPGQGLCLPVAKLPEFMKSIRIGMVLNSHRTQRDWVQAHAFDILSKFQPPVEAPRLIEEEPEAPVEIQKVVYPEPVVTSSELIHVTKAQFGGQEANAVNGRDLHAFLEVGKHFSTWMPEQIESFGFIEHTDYERIDIAPQNRVAICGAKTEYLISISMAKELAMVQRTAKGKQARLYFIECERRASAPVAVLNTFRVPTNLREALHLAAELEDKRMELACKVEEQTATISLLEPKANGLDIIATTAEGAHTLTESAKILQQAPRKFIKELERCGWIYRTNGNNAAYQDKIHQGLMEHKYVTVQHTDGPVQNIAQPLITPKGLTKLAAMFGQAS